MESGPRTIGMAQYYRVTLMLPLLVSAVVYLMGKDHLVPALPDIVWFSMLLGGMPYFTLAAVMFFWVKGRPEKAIHQVIYVSPFFMVLLLAIAVPVLLPVLGDSFPANRGVLHSIAKHAVFTLALGYLYVAAVQSVYLGLRAMRRIVP